MIWRRIAEWWDRLDDTDEDERLRAGMTPDEWYRKVQRPRYMRENGCETVAEYDALLDSWRAEANRRYEAERQQREAHARALWPKDKPYRRS